MNPLNVFNNYYCPLRYPKNWFSNIGTFLRSFKWAYQRVTRGFSDKDTWNLDTTLLNYLSGTLKHLAENTNGWPDNKFETFEDWQNYLKAIAQKFYQANESNEYYPTPAADEWWEAVKDKPFFEKETHQLIDAAPELSEKMHAESIENYNLRNRDFAEAWSMLGEVFWHLWD